MRRIFAGLGLAALISAGAVTAHAADAASAVMATITRMTDAVNRGEMPVAYAAFIERPSIVEDGAPYRWQGKGAPKAWIESMGANAQAHEMKAIEMRLSAPSRIETTRNRGYAIVPGRLSYTMKDGHAEHADGTLTFSLQRAGGTWKIETMTWTGPVAH
jgi:ketosteroid isomerase-like protein